VYLHVIAKSALINIRRLGGLFMNIMQIMKQAQNMQAKLKSTQEELANMEIIGESAGGAVRVVCDGQGRFKSIKLKAEAINSENPESVDEDTIEMLEDIISSAINQASEKASKEMEAKMKQATGGINIPGLF
jgi:DNA-binding YbaB/EbfC family protein